MIAGVVPGAGANPRGLLPEVVDQRELTIKAMLWVEDVQEGRHPLLPVYHVAGVGPLGGLQSHLAQPDRLRGCFALPQQEAADGEPPQHAVNQRHGIRLLPAQATLEMRHPNDPLAHHANQLGQWIGAGGWFGQQISPRLLV